MYKEIIGIVLLFFVLLLFISLFSYNPADPSLNHAVAQEQPIHNLFGKVGAYIAGVGVGLFGIGIFWLPILFFIAGRHYYLKRSNILMLYIVIGGVLLVISTSSFMALYGDTVFVFDKQISSGGVICILFKSLLLEYINRTGSILALILMFYIGFILVTRISIISKLTVCWVFFAKIIGTLCNEIASLFNTDSFIVKEYKKLMEFFQIQGDKIVTFFSSKEEESEQEEAEQEEFEQEEFEQEESEPKEFEQEESEPEEFEQEESEPEEFEQEESESEEFEQEESESEEFEQEESEQESIILPKDKIIPKTNILYKDTIQKNTQKIRYPEENEIKTKENILSKNKIVNVEKNIKQKLKDKIIAEDRNLPVKITEIAPKTTIQHRSEIILEDEENIDLDLEDDKILNANTISHDDIDIKETISIDNNNDDDNDKCDDHDENESQVPSVKINPAVELKPSKNEIPKRKVVKEGFIMPPIEFLQTLEINEDLVNHDHLRMMSGILEDKLKDFGVKGEVFEISPGPVITTFEYKPAPGVKISKIVNLSNDLALALSAMSIRIVAPIPGRDVIGIEIPNELRAMVPFRDIVISDEFRDSKSKLTLCLGKDIVGRPVTAALEKMPHLLIAGATGTGKSVGLNAMIVSLLYKATPDEVKLIMVDPKRIELSVYDGIPHLITPVVTDMKKATNALFWAVKEMERRYELLATNKVRNMDQYNQIIIKKNKNLDDTDGDEPLEKLPRIVIIIDELADLMMVASKDVETALTRLAQMARAAGLHIILATQRPSVDVLTGIIKANFPTRISFQVSSRIDSRTIIDSNGAENLLGNGDMLFVPPGTGRLTRIHGAYISEDELMKVIDHLKEQGSPDYITSITDIPEETQDATAVDEDVDKKYDEAVAFVTKSKQASISAVQRQLRIGYNRAARIIEMMEREKIIGPSDGTSRPREILVKGYE